MLEQTFNPLDKRNLAESVARELLKRDLGPVPPRSSFIGAGVYAIYYTGNFPPYQAIAERNRGGAFSLPIYVGKAVPPGARKGGFGLGVNPKNVLYKRLKEHADSVKSVNNLEIEDFRCRYLVTEDIWIPLAESLLIEQFRPLWNILVDGFGNHPPGKNRPQQRSAWDTLHPGRAWAAPLLDNALSGAEILTRIRDFFVGRPVKTIPTSKAVVRS